MYRQCITEKTAQQQKAFCNTLYRSMQDQFYSNISITNLCQQTGLSRNIFYRLFDCKDDVLFSLIDSFFMECANEIKHNNTRENLVAFYSFWKNKKDFLDILKKNRLESYLSIRGTVCSCQINFAFQKLIGCPSKSSDMEIHVFYISGFMGLLLHWYHSNFSRSIDEMVDITLQFVDHSTSSVG